MSQAKIGALHVSLGLDTAQFQAGAKRAQSTLGGLTSSLKAFAVGAAGALSLGAIVGGLRSSIDHMDKLGKAAQKIGIPVEELSKLEYAARLSDISLESLEGTIGRFSRNLAEIAGGGKNDAGAALKALGVSATDAQGKLRPTTEIMSDIAEEFEAMKDGAGKTALAIALFGRSGADLIPLLNGGKQAFSEASAEASAFGITVSTKAAKAAETFNDNLTRLNAAGQGITQQIAEALLPTLVDLTEQMVDFARDSDAAKSVAHFFAEALKQVSVTAATTYKEMYAIGQIAGVLAENMNDPQGPAVAAARWRDAFARIKAQAAETAAQIAKITGADDPTGSLASIDANFGQRSAPGKGDKQDPPIVDTTKKVTKGLTEAERAFDRLRDAGQSVWEQTRTPLENYQIEIRRLNDLLAQGVIDNDTYARAVKGLQDTFGEAAPAANEFAETMEGVAGSAIDSFLESLNGLASGTMTVSDAFENMKTSLLSDLSDLASQFLKTGLMNLLFGGGAGVAPSQQGGGLLGGLFGGFGGARAGGGPVSFGKSYLVGENGPELFSPGSSGRITPNDMMRGGGGATVNVYNQAGDATVEQRQRQNSDGSMTVDVWFKKKLQQHAPDVNRKAIPGAFGVPPSLTNR